MRASRGGLLAALACAAMALAAAPAQADLSFCPPGSGPGQCSNPQGVATDTETGRVYVADRNNNRINVFEADGTFVSSFGIAQLSSPMRLAVDNVAGSASRHDVYVVEAGQTRILKYEADGTFLFSFSAAGTGECQLSGGSDPNVAVGPGGEVYVGDSIPQGGGTWKTRIERFEPDGSCAGEVDVSPEQTRRVKAIAVDSGGNSYLAFTTIGGLIKYSPAGAELFTRDLGIETNALTVNGADELFVTQREPRPGGLDPQVISQYAPSGTGIRRFGYGQIASASLGVAAFSSPDGDTYFTQPASVDLISFPDPGPLVAPASTEVQGLGNTRATLVAEVNPEAKATSYSFDYVDEQSFEESGFTGPDVKSTPTTPIGAEDIRLHTVEATIGCPDPVTEAGPGSDCLTPETTYRFRVVATNADNPEGEGQARQEGPAFTTKAPLELLATFATEVGTDSARLGATVNPLGIPTRGHFEYVSEESFQESGFAEASRAPAAGELDFGASEAPTTRKVAVSGLSPDTAYRYRAVIEDDLIEAPVIGEAEILTTFAPTPAPESCPANEAFRTGASAFLPDCRAYEMVSPLDKDNGDIIPLGEASTALPASLDQSSLSGGKLVYGSYRSFGGAESAPFTTQYLAARGSGGWDSRAIVAPRGRLTIAVGSELDTELKALSPDLCEAWIKSFAEPVLAPGGVPGYSNLYRRQDEDCGGESYEALTTAEPPHLNFVDFFSLELQGRSADGKTALYVAPDNLPGTAAPENTDARLQLYQHDQSGLAFVCVLPGGAPSSEACQAGYPGNGLSRTANVASATSSDGSRVFWTAYPAVPGEGKIYVRIVGTETVAVSEEAEGLSGTSKSRFWAASADGARAIFTSGTDLYEFEVDSKATTPLAAGVIGLVGASEDARSIYFASEQELAPANGEGKAPVAGEPNLYLLRGGETRFIGTLAASDVKVVTQKSQYSPLSVVPMGKLARTTADGAHAAFMSAASLTGYDNADAASGKADAEVFLYDAEANGGEGALRCASCNPTGARPVGANIGSEINAFWAAAQIPVWQNTLYASRALAEDGNRLYFESTDVLVPRDTNGVQDVYQWEAAGSGGCDSSDSTYSQASGGCVELVSSGQSARAAQFTDASPDGEDVFFATLASLVSQDYGLVDIYDARVGGGFAAPPPAPVPCEGEACQSPAPAPAPLTPSSLSYRGPGDLAPAAERSRCAAGARRAKRRSATARRLARAARRTRTPARSRALRRRARSNAKQARRLSAAAKRCRARQRANANRRSRR